MIYDKNSKGQAAIEFLMTYGWMFLVVLVVGVSIFNFVNFETLHSNRLSLNNDLSGVPTEMVGHSNVFATPKNNTITVVFTYNNANKISIDPSKSILNSVLGGNCTSFNITNIDTNTYSNIPGSSITFINNQLGYLEFNCASLDSGIGLLPNDVFEGKIKITMFSTKTDLEKISSGEIRVRIEG